MRNIVMIGPQGSGKGTQSERLSATLGIPHVSLGTLFRAEAKSDSGVGKEIKTYIEKGEIVPITVANKVLTERISKGDAADGVILDGYPRTLEQADALENIFGGLGKGLTHVIYLKVSDDVAMRRLTGRRVCSNSACERNYHLEMMPPKKADVCDACGGPLIKRKDDVPDAISRRLRIYHEETTPLIDLYARAGLLHEIDGERPIDEVQAEIRAVVGA